MARSSVLQNYVLPVATLAGSIMGVGFYSLPNIALRAGVLTALAGFLIFGALVIFAHLAFGKIALKTPDYKRFPGFCGFYLGRWGKLAALVSSIFGFMGVLLVYLIVGGEFLAEIFGGTALPYTLIYFLAASVIIFFGIKIVSKIELAVIALLVTTLFVIFLRGFHVFDFHNLISNFKFQISNLFIPFGPIVFSLWGIGMIPETEEMLAKSRKKKDLYKIITVSVLLAALIYLIFIFLVLGITGNKTTDSALAGLKEVLGPASNLALFLGVITTFTAFITGGLTLKKILIYDLQIKERQAFLITCLSPLVLFLSGARSFVPVISLIGGVLLPIDAVLIFLIFRKLK